MKTALITGITGQDGSYLARLLLERGYRVFGSSRSPFHNAFRLEELGISSSIEWIDLNLMEETSVFHSVSKLQPDEIYNLAAQSSVSKSFISPLETARIDAFSVCYLLEAIRLHSSKSRFFQASSSEIYGNEKCISESSSFSPLNPYSIAKTYAHMLTLNYRKLYNLYLVCGILFNHDSELRGDQFFTKIVSRHVAHFHLGKRDPLRVGNINVCRDIGYAPEYADAIHLTLSGTIPEDYIISTGKSEPIRNFISYCFRAISIELEWKGSGIHEKAYIQNTNTILVEIDPEKFRPTEVDSMESDPKKIMNTLGWKAIKPLSEIAQKMVLFDINKIK
jgi:GDPmannose 4,6-dehydratase